MNCISRTIAPAACVFLSGSLFSQEKPASLTGWIYEDASGRSVAARVYIESEDGTFYFAEPADANGKAVTYEKKRKDSVEMHTCLSEHPFSAKLPPGTYKITAERGHEFLPATTEVTLKAGGTAEIELRLKRWIHMAERGWFSGETHVHRKIEELEVVMEAEDLNVAFPLTAWVTDSKKAPVPFLPEKEKSDPPIARILNVGFNRIVWPLNTEYEIFTVDGKRHTQGAFFVLNHQKPFTQTVPPVGPVFEEARIQGAAIDLDKHNWPWTMMLPVVAEGNHLLFELSNNHIWRTKFAFTEWYPEHKPTYMNIPGSQSYDEEGWVDFGFQSYYALLNCGFKIRPTAGTASGVHPVPLGFGRVYVKQEGGDLDFEEWFDGLKSGRSFVTTGPMLSITFSEFQPGSEISEEESDDLDETIEVVGRIESAHEIEKIEIVVNGEILPVETGGPIGSQAPHSAFVRESVELEGESWVALRVYCRTPEGRIRFAHTAPVWVEVEDGKPLLPSLLQAKYLQDRMAGEIQRNKDVLPEEAIAEFEKAFDFYRDLVEKALEARKNANNN
ncbi:MAG: carboxypeptidase regulatory-like domain-containing protein [Verrucomicrobiales bacterium]|nr:carboxypeptidase regulatory-like domain-containing protein [Verrucomicrobiales bacterium]